MRVTKIVAHALDALIRLAVLGVMFVVALTVAVPLAALGMSSRSIVVLMIGFAVGGMIGGYLATRPRPGSR